MIVIRAMYNIIANVHAINLANTLIHMYKTSLYKIDQNKLTELKQTSLGHAESDLQQWIWDDPDLLGLGIVLIGREVTIGTGARIDLLGVDENFNVCVIELKKDKTPREVIAQVLDYAAWISTMTWEHLDLICRARFPESAVEKIRSRFGSAPDYNDALEPRMIILASQLDEASERIAQFLTDRGLNLNALFFTTFEDGQQQLLARSWLIDPAEVEERVIFPKKHAQKHPASGFWFVNVGVKAGEKVRSWEDNRKLGFLSVGGGLKYEKLLGNIPVGAKVYAWLNGSGYVGLGEVSSKAVPMDDFHLADGSKLNGEVLNNAEILHANDPADYESAIGIKWIKTLDPANAINAWHSVMTACALNQPEALATLNAAFIVDGS